VSVTLNYSVTESLVLTVTTPTTVSLGLGSANAQTIGLSLTYNLNSNRTMFGILPYFTSTTALTGSAGSILSANVWVTPIGNDGGGACNDASAPALYGSAGAAGSDCDGGATWATSGSGFSGTVSKNFAIYLINPVTAIGSYTGQIWFVAAAV
jgi:hypothetical protein